MILSSIFVSSLSYWYDNKCSDTSKQYVALVCLHPIDVLSRNKRLFSQKSCNFWSTINLRWEDKGWKEVLEKIEVRSLLVPGIDLGGGVTTQKGKVTKNWKLTHSRRRRRRKFWNIAIFRQIKLIFHGFGRFLAKSDTNRPNLAKSKSDTTLGYLPCISISV